MAQVLMSAEVAVGGQAVAETQAQQQRREIIRLLSKGKSLVALIADPSQLDLRQACRVAKVALEEDPEFDSKLVELVKSGAPLIPDQVVRILMVLEAVCAPPRLLSHVLNLKHLEGRVRSKLTLIAGRLTRDPQWLRQQLLDESARVRANAIEGLWDVRAEGLEELLGSALRDPHHRVAANAALALYKIGNTVGASNLYSMLERPDEMFRRAALWAIGQTRDPRFLEAVARVAGKATGEEQVLAIRVNGELTGSRSIAKFISSLSLEVRRDEILESGERRVRLCCLADWSCGWLGKHEINALNFVIAEGETQIQNYRLNWVGGRAPFAALFVQPRSWNGNGELLRPALRSADVNEKYGFLTYQTTQSPALGRELDETSEVKLENYQETSREYLDRTYEVARDLDTAIRIGLSALLPQPGKRHLFVLVDPSVGALGAVMEISPADYAGVEVHAIVWDKARPELRESLGNLSLASGGLFAAAASARDFIRPAISVRAAQFGSLELMWRPGTPGKKAPARIRCYSSYGCGEVILKTDQLS